MIEVKALKGRNSIAVGETHGMQRLPHKPCKGEINQLVYFALTGLIVSPDARHRAMPCAIEFRPFRAMALN